MFPNLIGSEAPLPSQAPNLLKKKKPIIVKLKALIKVVKALEDQRARGTNGNRATDNYFENLNRKPQGDGGRSGRW